MNSWRKVLYKLLMVWNNEKIHILDKSLSMGGPHFEEKLNCGTHKVKKEFLWVSLGPDPQKHFFQA
jgi:hypothetical protein